MQPLTTPAWRVVRASAVALFAALLAAGGHLLGGGGLPDAPVLLLTAPTVGFAVSGLAHRALKVSTLVAVLLSSQLIFHLLFTLAPGPGMTPQMPMPDAAVPPSPVSMIVFHLLAAVLTGVALSGVDVVLFLLSAPLQALRLSLSGATRPVSADAPPAALRWVGAVALLDPARTPTSRRGPPGWPIQSLLSR